MLRMEIRLGTMRAGELPICVLLRDWSLTSRSGCRGSGPSRSAGQDATAALGADYMSGLIFAGKHLLLLHEWTLSIGRCHTLLRNHAGCRHRPQDRRIAAGCDRWRGRGNRLWMSRGCGCRRHHARGGGVLCRIRVVHEGIRSAASVARGRGLVAHAAARSARRTRCCRRSWRMRVATVGGLLHGLVARLKRWQGLGYDCRRLLLGVAMLGYRCGRGIRGRRVVYDIRRIVRQSIHNPSSKIP